MKNNPLVTALKGMVVGGTMLVPGVSGGSMAIILGIYDRLISSVSSFMKHKRKSFLFLMTFALGGGLGMFFLAKPLMGLIERYPMPMLYFFLGAVAGSIPLILRQAEVKKFTWAVPGYILLGVLVLFLLSLLPTGAFDTEIKAGAMSFLLLTAAGLIAAVALVLPGISVSYLLLLMGLYDETMRAIGEFYFPFLIPLGIGLLLGIILTTKILERVMLNYPQPTYLVILGFMIGSMTEVYPGFPQGWECLLCFGAMSVGFLGIYFLSKGEKNTVS